MFQLNTSNQQQNKSQTTKNNMFPPQYAVITNFYLLYFKSWSHATVQFLEQPANFEVFRRYSELYLITSRTDGINSKVFVVG